MDFGIVFPSYLDAWKDAAIAEDHGFTHAWFFDSHLLYSDVYVCMALAAEHTRRIKLGTAVAIPGNRIGPVTAHSIATINQLAPGRVILGLGTGFTGRNTMGLPPVPLKTWREHVLQCRGLLQGGEVLYREGQRQQWIRFLHPDHGYINVRDPIPIYIAASGPKALRVVGELGDGWITPLPTPERLTEGLAAIRAAAQQQGRQLGELYVMALTTACVIRPGESLLSSRVVARVGPRAIMLYHALWERSVVAAHLPEELRAGYRAYAQEYIGTLQTPEDRRYQEVHEGHLIYLKPGEERFLTEPLMRRGGLIGSGEEIVARVKALEQAGLRQIAVQVVTNGRELIEEFSREVIARYR